MRSYYPVMFLTILIPFGEQVLFLRLFLQSSDAFVLSNNYHQDNYKVQKDKNNILLKPGKKIKNNILSNQKDDNDGDSDLDGNDSEPYFQNEGKNNDDDVKNEDEQINNKDKSNQQQKKFDLESARRQLESLVSPTISNQQTTTPTNYKTLLSMKRFLKTCKKHVHPIDDTTEDINSNNKQSESDCETLDGTDWNTILPPPPAMSTMDRARKIHEIYLLEQLHDSDEATGDLWELWYSERGSENQSVLAQTDSLISNPDSWPACEEKLVELIENE